MTDPRILSLITLVFAALTTYSLYTGLRQQRDARRVGRAGRWYRNLSILTGIEYGLLTFVFLLRTATLQGLIPPERHDLVTTLYLVLLLPAALFAALVIQRVLKNMRTTGQARRDAEAALTRRQPTQPLASVASHTKSPEQMQRQRERRRKAAAARRRQSGRA